MPNKPIIKSFDLLSFLENESLDNVLRLKTLTIGSHSSFLKEIIEVFKTKHKNTTRIYVAYLTTYAYIGKVAYPRTKIVGWAQRKNRKIRGKYFHIGIYVDPNHRQCGIGSALLKKAKNSLRKNRLIAYPFDEKGKLFFIKNRV